VPFQRPFVDTDQLANRFFLLPEMPDGRRKEKVNDTGQRQEDGDHSQKVDKELSGKAQYFSAVNLPDGLKEGDLLLIPFRSGQLLSPETGAGSFGHPGEKMTSAQGKHRIPDAFDTRKPVNIGFQLKLLPYPAPFIPPPQTKKGRGKQGSVAGLVKIENLAVVGSRR